MDERVGRYGRHRLYGVPMSVLSTHSPIAHQTPYTKDMNKQPDLNAIMATYTKQYNAMMARSAAAKADVAAGTEILTPAPERGQWGVWNISDRH